MNTETDAVRLAEIGVRCERATEGPWAVPEKPRSLDCYAVKAPDDEMVAGFWSTPEDGGVVSEKDADFIAHAREDVPWLLEQLGEADAAWQATESRLVHICQLLSVDYTCEEPETCEQVIERLLGQLAAMRRAYDTTKAAAELAIHDLDCCGGDSSVSEKWLRESASLISDAGKPEADVLSAAVHYEDADRQYQELDPDNPWYGHYKEILLADRMRAKKDLCDAVKRLREGSSGTAATPDKGGGE